MSKTNEPTPTCNCSALREAARHVSQFYDRKLAPAGMSISQYTILHRLQVRGLIGVKELAAWLVMDPSTLTRNLSPLIKLGFIKLRAASVDKRAKLVELTAAGKKTHDRTRRLWLKAQAELEEEVGNLAPLRAELAKLSRADLGQGAEGTR